jgi:hypothetical protein
MRAKPKIRLRTVALLLCSCCTLSSNIRGASNHELTLECTVVRIAPDPGRVSGDTAVYRLVKYRVEKVCQGKYRAREIVVDHIVLTGSELKGLKLGDRVCLAVRKSDTILSRFNANGIRKASDAVRTFYIGAEVKPAGTTLCGCQKMARG